MCRCWMSSNFQHMHVVSYITTMAFPCLVILCNSCILGLVVFKLWGIRGGDGGIESRRGWKKMNKEKVSRLWKDCATVLGLSCVLGLPWGLMTTTFSLPGIYLFTILNSLQGQYACDPHIQYAPCFYDVLENSQPLLSLQVSWCSCGLWLWPVSLDLTITPRPETLALLRKWWQPASITNIHS